MGRREMQVCKDMIVVPPIGAQFETPEFLAEISALLDEAYPDYDFTITTISKFRDDSFVLIPRLGSVGGEGSVLAAYPDMTAMQEMGNLLFKHIIGHHHRDIRCRTWPQSVAGPPSHICPGG
ncbi:hypothetical protein X746_28475 [Mesorhizobium sp. LNJC380A00]|nr:hypothetical protein X746_28475 [Mesorhizobium sp. LNJC380A00]